MQLRDAPILKNPSPCYPPKPLNPKVKLGLDDGELLQTLSEFFPGHGGGHIDWIVVMVILKEMRNHTLPRSRRQVHPVGWDDTARTPIS